MSDENSLDVILASPNIGQRYIYGAKSGVRYGYYGGGELIPAVHKEDIRLRPTWFACAKCQSALTISANDVYCEACLRPARQKVQPEALAKSVEAVRAAPPPPPPPPVAIAPLSPAELRHEAEKDEADEWMRTHPKPLVYIKDIDFGRRINSSYKQILIDAGIVTLDDAVEKGHDGLIKIHGVGPVIADTLLNMAAAGKV